MDVLVIGSGGREHALAWCVARSPEVTRVFIAPGNAGTATENKCRNIDIGVDNFDGLVAFALDNRIDLTIVGPEPVIVGGVRDRFDAEGLTCFAPSQAAAQLEGSKAYAKRFMQRHGIPTAGYFETGNLDKAEKYVRNHGAPIVVKADGLAAGKGVVVATTVDEALTAAEAMLSGGRFGEAGTKLVLEDFLQGEEASFTVMSDGFHVLSFASSQDHKAAFDNDTGPNTGGMGAYSPAPIVDEPTTQRILDEIVQPTIDGMRTDGHLYQGFLYVGLMISPNGNINVVEFNCRFGDPEAQPVLMRLRSDLASLCIQAIEGSLANRELVFTDDAAVGVVMASGGYPNGYRTGYTIQGLQADQANLKVFHAGTQRIDNTTRTNGGRVICVTALADSIASAQSAAYQRVRTIQWPDVHYRTDIAERGIHRERSVGT